MKTPLTLLLIATVVTLLIVGGLCIHTATEPNSFNVVSEARTPSLIAGLTSFCLAVGLVVFGIVMGRKQP